MPVTAYAPAKKSLSAYDPVIASDQLKALQYIKKTWGVPVFCRRFFTILAKKEIWKKQATRLVPFDMTRIQLDLTNTAGKNNITVKGRQIGSTTWHILVRLLLPAILEPGSSGLLISQTKPYGAQHFRILQRALKHFARNGQPSAASTIMTSDMFQMHLLHTQYSARHEIVFDFLDSKVLVETAENPDAGTGLTVDHLACCLHPDTWIQKIDGSLARMKELKKDDDLLGSDGKEIKVKWRGIISAKDHPYKGEAVKIYLNKNSGFETICSPNHSFLTQRGLVESKDLALEDYVLYPVRRFSGELKKMLVPQIGKNSWVRGRCAKRDNRNPEDYFRPPVEIELDRELGFACGLYLAEGSASKKFPNRVNYCLSGKSEAYLAKRAYRRLRLFVSSFKVEREDRVYILYGKNIGHWIADNFGVAEKKHIPEWIWKAKKDFAIGLLEGWLLGDGSVHKNQRQITGVGKLAAVVLLMRDVAMALGLGGVGICYQNKKPKRTLWSNGYYGVESGIRFDLLFSGESFDRLKTLFEGRLGKKILCSSELLSEETIEKIKSKYKTNKFSQCDLAAEFGVSQSTIFDVIHKKSNGQKGADWRKTWIERPGYIGFKVRKLGTTTCKEFVDIEVSAKNHLYCLPFGVTHNTELAYWGRDPESLLAQAKEAVPANGTKDYESTPNGMGGYFFEEWQRAQEPKSEFNAHFYPWWFHEEYQEDPPAKRDSMTEEEEKMAKEFDWTMKQLTWRRKKQIALRGKFEEKYPENSSSCWLTSGTLFFDSDALRWLKFETQKTKPLDSFHSGQLKIFKRRIKGRRYIIGADVAEGKLIATDRADFSAAMVLDVDTGEQCAVYRSHLPPEDFAQDLVDLAQQYNNAMLAIERNGPGGSVILAVQKQCLYGNIYYHKEWYRERKQVVPVAGYPTNLRTRPIALNKVASAIRTAPELIHSEDFVNECLTFVWRASNKKQMGGKRVPQGAEGCHDDLVLAMACAEYTRLVSIGYLDPIEIPSERYGQIEEEEDENTV